MHSAGQIQLADGRPSKAPEGFAGDAVCCIGRFENRPPVVAEPAGQVAQLFGQEARCNLPPEEVVSLGAALLADSLRRDKPTSVDVCGTHASRYGR